MKLLIEIDTNKKMARLIETTNLTVDNICQEVCSYFGISMDKLTKRPLTKEDDYTKCRQYISLFLVELLGCKHDHVESILNYSSFDKANYHTGVVSYNISKLRTKLVKEIKLEKSKGILGEYTRSYNNLLKILIQSTIKK